MWVARVSSNHFMVKFELPYHDEQHEEMWLNMGTPLNLSEVFPHIL